MLKISAISTDWLVLGGFMIRLERINKSYKEEKVLKDINVSFRDKDFVCILGPSGSGKTTLLNLIGGNDLPTSGHVYIDNNDLLKINLDYYHNEYISFIFQSYNLINNLSIYDNVTLGLRLTNKFVDKAKIMNILKDLKLKNAKTKASNLSGGEKQRVAIARCLVSDSKIILADEPTGALDSVNSHKIMQILKELSKTKLVIVVTHNEKLANQYASRIIKINDGKIVSDTNPYNEVKEEKITFKKPKLKLVDLLKICLMNLKTKKSRNILTIIAFSIGLFSLSLVLAISTGFKSELKNLETNSLYNYPLVISRETLNLEPSINNNQKYNKELININENNEIIINKIDDKLINILNKIDLSLIDGISYYKEINSSFKNISYINPNNKYFNLIDGKYPVKDEEVMLLLDQNNAINKNVYNYLKINSLEYKDVLNKTFTVEQKHLKIVGIVNSNNNYFVALNGIIYNDNLFDQEITDIYIYPKDYPSKEKIKTYLSDYFVTDNARSVINLTSSLIKGISIILIIFSFISLIVSIIMIAIISYIAVLEREPEIGIMKSLGVSKKDIKRIFIIENNLIGLCSSILALDFTFNLSKVLNKYISNKLAFNDLIDLNSNIIISIIILSIFLTYIASVIPAKVASKKKIVNILHNS